MTNESLDAEALEFLRIFNRYYNRTGHRSQLVQALASISNGPLVTLPEDELVKFMGLFKESNEKVAAEYFGGPIRRFGQSAVSCPHRWPRARCLQTSL